MDMHPHLTPNNVYLGKYIPIAVSAHQSVTCRFGTDPETSVLDINVGDAVIGNPPGQCGLLREKVMDDPARLRRSVRQLLGLDFDVLLFGDGASILRDANKRLKELVDTFPSE